MACQLHRAPPRHGVHRLVFARPPRTSVRHNRPASTGHTTSDIRLVDITNGGSATAAPKGQLSAKCASLSGPALAWRKSPGDTTTTAAPKQAAQGAVGPPRESLRLALAKSRIGKKRFMLNPEVASPWPTAPQAPVHEARKTCEARPHNHGRAILLRPSGPSSLALAPWSTPT